MSRPRRRLRAAVPIVAAVFALAAAAVPSAHAAPLTDVGYWAFADRMQERLGSLWDEDAGYYRAGSGGVEPMANSLMLLTHSVAAMEGHQGPARDDARARRIARRLVEAPPFVTTPPASSTADSQVHAPGWVSAMDHQGAPQHLVFDAEVIDGLAYAYRARHALGLPPATARRIRAAIHATARGDFWRWPAMRLNQVNWYALVYAADATVTGDGRMLRHDLKLQLRRFFRGARGTGGRAGNFGAGMHFHYLPFSSPREPRNLDSAEYASIVLSFTRFYGQARRAGMPPLEPEARRLMREWARRAIAGYWTHAGYMNWDSGLGFKRWHQAKKLGLTQQALIGLASSPSLLPDPRWARWAKHMLDRGLGFYDRLSEAAGGIAEPVLFGLTAEPQGVGSARLAAARIQANAARAVAAGLGRVRSAAPPPLYAYDPDTGRLAVTTPAYNTAVVPVNRRAFPYGGLDLARLFDGDQRVLANVGGTPPASFGLLVRDGAGRRVLSSQTAQVASTVRLTRAPSGAGARASAPLGRAFAGPFGDLRAAGTVRANGLSATVSHRFLARAIETRWLLRRTGADGARSADVLFPSWGGRAATVTATGADGRVAPWAASRSRSGGCATSTCAARAAATAWSRSTSRAAPPRPSCIPSRSPRTRTPAPRSRCAWRTGRGSRAARCACGWCRTHERRRAQAIAGASGSRARAASMSDSENSGSSSEPDRNAS